MRPEAEASREITFVVDPIPGGYSAQALEHPISAAAGCPEALRAKVRQAVIRHFAQGCPGIIRFRLRKLLT